MRTYISIQVPKFISNLEMQWKWKAWLQVPHATVHSSLLAPDWLAWHSMHRSIMWLRQMAQLSTWMSHAHNATADHFFTSKRFLGCSWDVDGCSVSIFDQN